MKADKNGNLQRQVTNFDVQEQGLPQKRKMMWWSSPFKFCSVIKITSVQFPYRLMNNECQVVYFEIEFVRLKLKDVLNITKAPQARIFLTIISKDSV